MNKYLKAGILLLLVGVPAFLFSLIDLTEPYSKVSLIKYYPKGLDSLSNDTIYHTVPDYSFLNQDSILTDSKLYDNKIQVVDFKFTTCKTICPTMTSNMIDVYSMFLDDKDIMFISLSVDPETDQPFLLRKYKKKYKIINNNWTFLTGDSKDIYRLARKGFYISSFYDQNEDDFVHSEKVILVDKDKVIRGYFDATDEEEIDRLKTEIKVLKKEYEQQAN